MKKLILPLYLTALRLRTVLVHLLARVLVPAEGDHTFRFAGYRITERHDDPYFRQKLQGDCGEYMLFRRAVERFCAPHPTILDIGANIGMTALVFAAIPGSRVIAFEPMPRTYAYLRRNAEANGLANLETHCLGLSDQPGTARIGERAPGMDSASFGILDGSEAADGLFSETVALSSLDVFVADAGLERVDYLKIDVQGWDTHVLKGGLETIRKHRPVIQIEVAAAEMELGVFDKPFLLSLAAELDCAVYSFYRTIRPVGDLAAVLGDPRAAIDILLVPARR